MKSRPTDLEVFLSHRPALVAYAARIVGCRAGAEDIVQDAFLNMEVRRKAFMAESAGGAEDRSPVGRSVSFFYQVVRNAAIDWLRRPDTSVDLIDVGALDRLPADVATPEQAARDREQLKILTAAMADLPERTRIAFEMHRLEGRSLREVAAALNISVVRAHQLVKDAIRHGAAALDAWE